MNLHAQRVANLQKLLETCRRKRWTDQTPMISDKLDGILMDAGLQKATRREYRQAIIMFLAQERTSGKPHVFPLEQNFRGDRVN